MTEKDKDQSEKISEDIEEQDESAGIFGRGDIVVTKGTRNTLPPPPPPPDPPSPRPEDKGD